MLKNTTDSYVEDIAHIIYECSRATGAYEAVQGLSDLFTTSSQNDDVQDFDVGWGQALLSVSEMPSEVMLEGLYTSKLQDSIQTAAFVNSRTASLKASNQSLCLYAVCCLVIGSRIPMRMNLA